MELQKFFKDYMNDYKGLDIYRETVDGQYFNEWNYEDGCLLLGCKKMYEVTGDDFYREYICDAGWLSFLYSSDVHHTVSLEFSSITIYLSLGERPV